jgi:hypothetical protein
VDVSNIFINRFRDLFVAYDEVVMMERRGEERKVLM